WDDGEYRPEDLFLRDAHVRPYAVEQRGLKVESVAERGIGGAPAARRGPFPLPGPPPAGPLHPLPLTPLDDLSPIGTAHSRSDTHRRRPLGQSRHERAVRFSFDEQTRSR